MDPLTKTEVEEEEKSKLDTFLYDNLPGAMEMLKSTLPNKDIIYYPYNISSHNTNILKAFDFISQKTINEAEDFISIDNSIKTNISNQNKSKKNQKKSYNTKSNNKNINIKNNYLINQQPKFKISQTINPDSSWKIISDYNKLTLEKLIINTEIKVEEKLLLGNIYNIIEDINNRINPYNPVNLNKYEDYKFFGNITTLEDEKIKSGTDFANVFVTDKILSVVFTCIYNSHPWHLKITKLGDNIFIDKMEGSEIDLVTVNESDNTPSDENDRDINGYKSLAIEATLINEFIKEQVIDLKSEKMETDGKNPFYEDGEDESKLEHLGYRYGWK